MTVQAINIGNIANDGTGDDLREAFIKVNDNFENLDNRFSSVPITVENLGGSGEGIFLDRTNNTLRFKELLAGNNVTLTSNSSSIIINSTGGLDNFLILTDNGSLVVDGSAFLGISGGPGINTRTSMSNLIIDIKDGALKADGSPELSATLNAANNNISNANTVTASSFIGSLTGLVHGYDLRDIGAYFEEFDFGEVLPNLKHIIDYLVFTTDVDFGTFVSPVDFNIDLGTFI